MNQLTKTQNLIAAHTLAMTGSIKMVSDHVEFLKRVGKAAGQVGRGEIHEDVLLEILKGFPNRPTAPLVGAKDATSQFDVVINHIENDWLSDDQSEIEYDMMAMYLCDAADHLAVAIAYRDGVSAEKILDMLWDMDTAAREMASDDVWDYGNGEE